MNDEELIATARKHWEHWAGVLGLQNWRVLFRVTEGDDYAMKVDWQVGYKKIAIDIARGVDHETEFSEPTFSLNVLHEALHVVLYRMKEYGEREVGDGKSSGWRLFSEAHEDGVDTLTSIIWRLAGEA